MQNCVPSPQEIFATEMQIPKHKGFQNMAFISLLAIRGDRGVQMSLKTS